MAACVAKFRKLVNCHVVVDELRECAAHVAPWVNKYVQGGEDDGYVVSAILVALFRDAVCEVGETIARKSTAKYCEEVGCDDPFGEVLEVSVMSGHMWVRFAASDSPMTRIEVSLYDNTRKGE